MLVVYVCRLFQCCVLSTFCTLLLNIDVPRQFAVPPPAAADFDAVFAAFNVSDALHRLARAVRIKTVSYEVCVCVCMRLCLCLCLCACVCLCV